MHEVLSEIYQVIQSSRGVAKYAGMYSTVTVTIVVCILLIDLAGKENGGV